MVSWLSVRKCCSRKSHSYKRQKIGVTDSTTTSPSSTEPTTITTPENVGEVKVVDQNETSITLTWEKVNNISYYTLRYDENGEPKVEIINAPPQGTSVKYVVSPLTPGTKYSFTLITVLEGVNSTGYSFTAVTAPEKVKGVTVVDQNETSITLTWDKVSNISYYTLQYDENGEPKVEIINAPPQGTSVKYVVSPLTPGTKYSFTLITVLEGVNSTGYSFTAVTAPENVGEVKVVDQNETSITLTWEKVNNISYYTLRYDENGEPKVENIDASLQGRSVEYVVSPLTPGTKYSFTLITVLEGVNSTGYSFTAVTAPEKVKGVTVVDQNETSITLTWDKVSNISYYTLRYDENGEPKVEIINAPPQGTSVKYVVSPLTPGTKYSFTLITVLEGVNSTGYSFTAVTAPENVGEVKVVDQNETSITLTWEKVNNISYYTLRYDENGEPKVENIDASLQGRSVEYVVSPLTAGTKYSFTLITVLEGVNSTGYSFTAVTAPENVGEVKVVDQNETSITLTWEKVNNISYYTLRYDENGEPKVENIDASLQDTSVEYVVSPLTAGTKYSFTLITVFEEVHSTGHSFTAVTAPEKVKGVTVVDQNETSITLTWDKVNNISYYTLRYDENGEPKVEIINAPPQGTSVKYVVSPLTPGTKYSFTLITVFEEVHSTGFSFDSVTVPLVVDYVNVTDRSLTSVTLTWKKVNKAWGYVLEINGVRETFTPDQSSDVSHSVTPLKPGTAHNFSLVTVFSELNSTAFSGRAVTTIDCASVEWHVSTSSIQGTVEGEFTSATATYNLQTHVSPGGRDVSFTDLVSGATYEISLKYNTSSELLDQCRHDITVFPSPPSNPHCDYYGGGYSASVIWNKPVGVWTTVEVNVTGESYKVDDIEEQKIIIQGLQPARTYQVSLNSVSGHERRSNSLVFSCSTDPRGVIAGSVIGVLLFCLLVCLAVFIFLKRPDIISRKKPFISGSKQTKTKGTLIPVARFPDHFNKLNVDDNRGFSEEYEDLAPVGTNQTQKAAELPDNKVRNRFKNVLPYDWCRVKLSTLNGTSDYINANYMPGYNSNREYIASQGPLPATVNDFWKMIWEQRVKGIVMVTNCTEGGKIKCEQYWPADIKPCLYGELLVTVRSEEQNLNWTIREFSVEHKNTSEERSVKHFHFTAWPDHGVPEGSEVLIQFRELVRRHIEKEGARAPTVVHCSAGVGRTGTIIALDVLLQQLEKERGVGIKEFVHKMRLNRPHMVQTESQYVFLHQCIMDSLQPNQKPEDNIYENADLIYENATALRELR
ncbi:receptor-type tyrosine-protein phosphatase H isoform X5 [Acanthochromis polyacanthus]|uniref:receptor-type tyrosine-protein phosphatase H isoform X5 n=1 Tax=Acanthochromis polyacanthus TaxID=80966 RepID=UPI0022347CA1|nr:receptor-type tyrosine-protein phosphatase H isoform X5 [Acanthochromis polyacanthus]